jgi:hypothetical protein
LKKVIRIVCLSLVGILLTACGTSDANEINEKTSSENANAQSTSNVASRQIAESKNENYPEPSTMALITSDGLYQTKRGTYSWSVVNEKTKETRETLVDIEDPLGLVTVNNALPLTVNGDITFKFEFEPYRVDINVWEQDGSSSTYASISDIQERGNYVVEFVAFFEQGTVTYVNAFDLK